MTAATAAAAPALVLDRIEIRMATKYDNESLLALTRMTPMAGKITLRIDRDPDFFALLRYRGNAEVFVAARRDQVIACVSVAFQHVYTGGISQPVAYIGDLKVHPRFAGTRVVLRLFATLRAYVEENGVDLLWSLVASGNFRVMPLLAGRLGIAPFVSAGRFIVDELLSSPFAKRASRYAIEEATPEDESAINTLLDDFHRSRQLAPHTSRKGEGEDVVTTLVARKGASIVATLELFDPGRLKRNVVLGAPLLTRMLLGVLRPASAVFAGPPMPRIGEAVRMAYLRRFACAGEHIAALAALVQYARTVALRKQLTFVAIGLHERDPLRNVVRGIPRFSFSSLAFVANLGGSRGSDAVIDGIPFEDFALV